MSFRTRVNDFVLTSKLFIWIIIHGLHITKDTALEQ